MEQAQVGLTKWGRLAAFLPLVSLMASCPAVAETVALWPLCDNRASPSVTGVFAGDSRFDLTVSTVGAVPTVEADPSTPGGWNLLPPPGLTVIFR